MEDKNGELSSGYEKNQRFSRDWFWGQKIFYRENKTHRLMKRRRKRM